MESGLRHGWRCQPAGNGILWGPAIRGIWSISWPGYEQVCLQIFWEILAGQESAYTSPSRDMFLTKEVLKDLRLALGH